MYVSQHWKDGETTSLSIFKSAVVGYGVKIFLPSPPNYVSRSPGKVNSIGVIFDFLAAYSTHLENELTKILQDKKVLSKTTEKLQKWITSQNCEIVKRFASFFR